MTSDLQKKPSISVRPILQKKDRLLFEGDSLTAGLGNNYGRLLGWDKTWADMVDEWLFLHRPELELECENHAVGGSSAKTMLARVDAALGFRPTVVLLTIGMNDVKLNVPVEMFREQLLDWCRKLQSAGCRTFLLVGGFSPCPNVDEETRARLEGFRAYSEAGREVIEAQGGFYIDVAPYTVSRAEILDKRWSQHSVYSGGVHHNVVGNQLVAGAVLTYLGFWSPQ